MSILKAISDSIRLMRDMGDNLQEATCEYFWNEQSTCLSVKIGSEWMTGPSDFFRDGRLSEDGYNKAVQIVNKGYRPKKGYHPYSTQVIIRGSAVIKIIDRYYDTAPKQVYSLFEKFENEYNGPPIVSFER